MWCAIKISGIIYTASWHLVPLFLVVYLFYIYCNRWKSSWCHGIETLPGVRIFCVRIPPSWWRHQMETFSALLAICAGNSPVPGRGCFFICGRINGWINNGEAGDLKRHRADYDVIVMITTTWTPLTKNKLRISFMVCLLLDSTSCSIKQSSEEGMTFMWSHCINK